MNKDRWTRLIESGELRPIETRRTECPSCGHPLNAAACFYDERETREPQEGDVTICAYCEHPMILTEDLDVCEPEDFERDHVEHVLELTRQLDDERGWRRVN